jgi:hypothetical protein
MRKNNFFSAVILGSAILLAWGAAGLAKDLPVPSRWLAAPLRIDGQNQDWAGDALTTEKGVKVDYAFGNDGRNLYVLFVFNDPKFLSSIDATGITIYFSPAGKKQKDFGVRFIKKNVGPDEVIATYEKQGIALTEEKKKEIMANRKYILFEADAVNKTGEVIAPSQNPADVDPPAFRSARQGNLVVYEFRVPLVARDLHPAGVGAAPGQTIKVGFEWGGLTDEMKKAMASNMGGQGTRAGASDVSMDETIRGGNENEGMSAASSSPSLARMRMGPKKYSFWVDVALAQAQ